MNKLKYPGSLHNHTDYSNLRLRDAIIRVPDLIDRAIELGQEVVAFTEHETVSNAIKIEEYYQKIKKDNPNFKVILGNEIYLCRDGLNEDTYNKESDVFYHYILLAKNAKGHEQIREISTKAWSHSFKTGTMTRVPTWYSDLIEIISKDPGNVIGSSACLGSQLSKNILAYYNNPSDTNFYQNHVILWCTEMERLFGKGNFYLELQPAPSEEQKIVNKELIKLSKQLDIPYIITTDSHYLRKEDASVHKAFLNAQDGDREVDTFYAATYLQSTEEVEQYLDYLTEEELQIAYSNILDIKDKCEDYSLFRELKIPSLAWKTPTKNDESTINHYVQLIPILKDFLNSEFDGDRIMAQLIINKFESDNRLQNEKHYQTIESNLKAVKISSEVNKTHWSAYFLNLQKTIEVCWNSGTLVGCGRGSGVGFLLLYFLDIIQINPLWETTQCFEWRFLNPDRVSVLDIDTDIEGGRRAQVLQGLRDFYGQDNVANVVTFGTEKSKSALQTAARGLGIDSDESLYLASLIPADRGQTRTLQECYYGDKEKGMDPIPAFVKAMNNDYPELWNVAQKIEGLVCRVGEHAGGVIFVDEPFTKSTALMKVPNGDIVTQFDLHDCEKASLIKIDLLSVECLDKIHNCIDLLAEYGYVDKNLTLRQQYEKLIGIYNLERQDLNMWKMIWNHEILSLFQMEQQSGIQGIDAIHPKSVDELAVLNSVIRLMAPDQESERPLDTWVRNRQSLQYWIKEMQEYGLSEDEIEWLSHHSAITEGICESQEGLMSLVQEPRLGGHTLGFADRCRKAIAKKQGKLFQECEQEFYDEIQKQNLSQKLAHYVWDVLLRVQRGYSFNRSHCLAYSLIALQEMNLCFKYPIIYWNTACLITDSGTEEAGTDYDKIATAIGKMRNANVHIELPEINSSSYGFVPNEKQNIIYCGFKSLVNMGTDSIEAIIANRPYVSPKDFLYRVKPNKQTMISLIKGGAFDNMMERRKCMAWYLWETCDKKSNLTMNNMPTLIKYDLIPKDNDALTTGRRIFEFNRYLKAICKYDTINFKLDDRALEFLSEINYPIDGELLNMKIWDKYYQKQMDVFRNWMSQNKAQILDDLNFLIFKADWEKYALGSISAWEMTAVCFYYHEHELAHVNKSQYGIVDFDRLPEEPEIECIKYIRNKPINIFKLVRICGTCIAKNKTKGIVTLLTTSGVVNVKFRKEYFALFDRQISAIGEDGKKHVVESSWFNRGNKIMVLGIRSGDTFVVKKYANSIGHQLYKINTVFATGELTLQSERAQGEAEDEEI